MKLNEISSDTLDLLDRAAQNDEDSVERAYKQVLNDCVPFLSQLDNVAAQKLYRGMENRVIFAEKGVKADRKPRDMDLMYHNEIDNWFLKNFGHRFRSNAAFTSSDYNEIKAAAYGTPHLFYPKGSFKIAWSPQVKDLWVSLNEAIYNSTRKKYGVADPTFHETRDLYFFFKDHPKALSEFIDNFMKNNQFKTGDLVGAIESGNEVMVVCDSYYVTTIDNFGANLQKMIDNENT